MRTKIISTTKKNARLRPELGTGEESKYKKLTSNCEKEREKIHETAESLDKFLFTSIRTLHR